MAVDGDLHLPADIAQVKREQLRDVLFVLDYQHLAPGECTGVFVMHSARLNHDLLA
ncbi:MAG: hypothetical protein ACWGPN_13450 [Gammaproteobacteria bacterium]